LANARARANAQVPADNGARRQIPLDTRARDALARGVAFFEANRLDEAAAQLELGGSLSPPGSSGRRRYFKYMIQLVAFRRGDLHGALELCRQATQEAPDDVDAWLLTGRARAEKGEPLQALIALRRAWRMGPDARVAYELCKIFDAAGRRRLAAEYGALAHELGYRSDNLLAILGKNLLQLGQHERSLQFTSLIESPDGSATYGKGLRELAEKAMRERRFLEEHPDLPRPRHIAIGGENYVGSTLLGLLLGSLPGVAFAGETQVLTHRWDVTAQANVPIEFALDAPNLYNHCRACGRGCERFDAEFRGGLIQEPADTYGKIARRLGARVLVTSDKAVTRLAATDPLYTFDLIILFKPPEPWIRSYARQRNRAVLAGQLAADAAGDVTRWLEQWCNTYEGLLRLPAPLARRAVLDWERFVSAPHAHFDRLLGRFELAGDASVFEALDIGCFVGGNETDNLQEAHRSRRVSFKQSAAPPLSEGMRRELNSHTRSIRMAARLERLYQADFAGIPHDSAPCELHVH
jgi:tetratricopeptide (TPR) repeat protein